MKKSVSFCFFAGLLALNALAQTGDVQVSGRVVDLNTGESLIGASVTDARPGVGIVTNQYGQFSLRVLAGTPSVQVSSVGYEPQTIRLAGRDTSLTVRLTVQTLAEVSVRNKATDLAGPGFLKLSVQQLKSVPMLLGEADLMKALATTPGIVVGQEGSSGLYVRGGSPDQNLILLDEVPVYNPAHVFGFLSVFNPDAIKNIDVYKGGFPARFGGRLSSVLDITTKEGNRQKANQDLSIGLISSKLLLEGPVGKGNTSYLLTARQMNTSVLLLPLHLRYWSGDADSYTNLWFYDANAKISHTFADKSQLFLSVYTNQDAFVTVDGKVGRQSKTRLGWGNNTVSLRYNRMLRPNLFARATLLFSRFSYTFASESQTKIADDPVSSRFSVSNTVRDWGGKAMLEYLPSSRYTLRGGIEQTWQRFRPGLAEYQGLATQDGAINLAKTEPILAINQAAYVENEYRPLRAVQLNAGVRASRFGVENRSYTALDPRLSVSVRVNPAHTLKAGYTQMTQFMHQLTSNGVGIPNDVWVPATARVGPTMARQLDLGWYWDIKNENKWLFSLELYRKQMSHLIDYPQGQDILSNFNKNWQDLIVQNGSGRAYGFETMLRKEQGRLSGWLSYTYARSERQFAEINDGRWYAARYNREHSATLVATYALNKKWSFSLSQVIQSGFPVTLPVASAVDLSGRPIPVYTDRNNYRMPTYHRLDLGATYAFRTKLRNREAAWSFGLYNAYNRANPYYLSVSTAETSQYGAATEAGNFWRYTDTKIGKGAVFPILPYITYRLKF